jgi:large subunit ribosomal protein L18
MGIRAKKLVTFKQQYSPLHRLRIWRTSRHMYAYIVSTSGQTLFSLSTLTPDVRKQIKKDMNKKDQAKLVGSLIGKLALSKGIKKVCFNRAGFLYHGRVASLADGAREADLDF